MATNTQRTWRQEFLGSRSSTVERSSTRTAAARTFLRFFQTIFENTPLWRLKRLVTLRTYRRYINECIYLSIYLSISEQLSVSHLNRSDIHHSSVLLWCFFYYGTAYNNPDLLTYVLLKIWQKKSHSFLKVTKTTDSGAK